MWDRWQSDSKIKVTQHVLLRFLDSIQGQTDMEVALRVFGHLNNGDFGTSLEVPFEQDNFYKLRSKIKTLVPNGGCTAASAFSGALKDFPSSDLYSLARFVKENYGMFHFTCDHYDQLIDLMRHDKKSRDGEINCTLLKQCGDPKIDNTITTHDIKAALDIYRDLME